MDFISNKELQKKSMLAALGLQSLEELFAAIPADLKIPASLEDDGLSEYEGLRLMEALAAKNTFAGFDNYIGAGAYEHHVPALVGAICSKSEFLTSYTPYQAEASQGMLQAIFEFQSVICALTGLDVANASVYDGAGACAEAVLMALRCLPARNKIFMAESLHPHYQAVVRQYLQGRDYQVEVIPFLSDGRIDLAHLEGRLDEQTAAVLIQSPNFFGVFEQGQEIFKLSKLKGALGILCANPGVYGLCRSAAEQQADIAVGDCQPFGIPLQFGGPYAGYMACKQEYLRQLPGRIVGETIDREGKRGFVLTLQAREQHIRREKATSNICTNQALAALASLVAMLWYGKEGLRAWALTNFQRAAYLKNQLAQIKGIEIIQNAPTFNEFVAKFNCPLPEVLKHFQSAGIQPGLNLESYYPNLKGCLLIAVTETKTLPQLNRYVEIAKRI